MNKKELKKQLSQKELINKAKDIAFFADEPLTQEILESMDKLQKYIAMNEQKLIQQNIISQESNDANLANQKILGESELINRNNYIQNPDWIWFDKLPRRWFFLSTIVTASVIFLILHIGAFRGLVSNPNFNDFVLHYLPTAQAWQNATINYKNEIVFISLYLWGLYLVAFCLFVYTYFLNWKRTKNIFQSSFIYEQLKNKICSKKIKSLFALFLLIALIYGFSILFQGYQSPMTYDDYRKTSGIGLNEYETWNTAIGLYMVVLVKGIAIPFVLIKIPIFFSSFILCQKYKSNN